MKHTLFQTNIEWRYQWRRPKVTFCLIRLSTAPILPYMKPNRDTFTDFQFTGKEFEKNTKKKTNNKKKGLKLVNIFCTRIHVCKKRKSDGSKTQETKAKKNSKLYVDNNNIVRKMWHLANVCWAMPEYRPKRKSKRGKISNNKQAVKERDTRRSWKAIQKKEKRTKFTTGRQLKPDSWAS